MVSVTKRIDTGKPGERTGRVCGSERHDSRVSSVILVDTVRGSIRGVDRAIKLNGGGDRVCFVSLHNNSMDKRLFLCKRWML